MAHLYLDFRIEEVIIDERGHSRIKLDIGRNTKFYFNVPVRVQVPASKYIQFTGVIQEE